MTQNDKANLEEMVRCCRQMEAFTGRYDHICIRFYGDAMNTPALLDNCAEQLLELGRIAGQFSEAFYTQHNTTRWKEMYFRMDQSIRKNGRFSDEAVWNEMENCSRWTPELCEMLREEEKQHPKDRPYLVLDKVSEEVTGGMGDTEFIFAYLCVNEQGEHCIVTEEYIQYHRKDMPAGIRYLDPENLYAWNVRILTPDETDGIRSGRIFAIDGKTYVMSGRLISERMLPPFTPQIAKYYQGVFRHMNAR